MYSVCKAVHNKYMKKGATHSQKTKKLLRDVISTLYKTDLTYRKRVSAATKKAMKKPDTLKKLSIARKGKPRMGDPANWKHTKATKEKLRISATLQNSQYWKNKRFSKKHRKQLSISHMGKASARKGVSLSKITRLKLSKSLTGRKMSAATKEKIRLGNTGKTVSKETCKKMREWHIKHPNKKFSNTKIEQKVASELERRGFIRNEDFFQNFGISEIKNVDFYLPKSNVIIECDGCFYHACPEHGNPNYHQSMSAIDVKNTILLEAAGYNVFRFWEHAINKDTRKCLKIIK